MQFASTSYRPSLSAPGDGSRTMTLTGAPPREEEDEDEVLPISDDPGTVGALRLRGGPRSGQRVAWNEDVIDNEGCGKKKSKICCIYHKPRRFDESSDEDSSDSDADSDVSSCDAHSVRHRRAHAPRRVGDATPSSRPDHPTTLVNELQAVSEPNAYESISSSRKGERKGGS